MRVSATAAHSLPYSMPTRACLDNKQKERSTDMTVRHSGASRALEGVRQAALAGMGAAALSIAAAPRTALAQETIKIGVPVPLSGGYEGAGKDILNGAQ